MDFWSTSSVKGIDAVLGKVHLPYLSSSKNGVHFPLLWSCPLGFCSITATRSLPTLTPLPAKLV